MEVEAEWAKRASVPDYVYKMIKSMPKETHPMTLFSQAVLALQNGSVFAQQISQHEEGCLLGSRAGRQPRPDRETPGHCGVYLSHEIFRREQKPKYNPKQDYGMNFARMMKVSDKKGYAELARLYFILHSDHESGNVSAHTMHLVGSALSDPYLSFSAALERSCRSLAWTCKSGMPRLADRGQEQIWRRSHPR